MSVVFSSQALLDSANEARRQPHRKSGTALARVLPMYYRLEWSVNVKVPPLFGKSSSSVTSSLKMTFTS